MLVEGEPQKVLTQVPTGKWVSPWRRESPRIPHTPSSPSQSSLPESLNPVGELFEMQLGFFFFFEWLLQIQPRRGEIVTFCMSNGKARQQRKKKPSKPSVVCRQVQNTTCFPAGKLLLEKTGTPQAPAWHASEIFKVNRCFSFRFGFAPSHKTPCVFTSKLAIKPPQLQKEKGSSAS